MGDLARKYKFLAQARWKEKNKDKVKRDNHAYYERMKGVLKPRFAEWQRQRIARHEANGWCNSCKRPRLPGLKICSYHQERRRYDFFRRKYGISKDDYQRMMKVANGKCQICGESPVPLGKKNGLQVDHDHVSGVVRGILCWRCNQGLWYFGDNPKLLKMASEYISSGSGVVSV